MSGEEPNNQDGLSQEDIDAAFASAGGGEPEAAAPEPDGAAESAEPQAAAETPTPEAATPEAETTPAAEAPSEPAASPDEDSGGPFSQADIDAALAGEEAAASAAEAPAAEPAAAETPAEAVGQEDIDAVLAAGAGGGADAGGALSQDDIDAALNAGDGGGADAGGALSQDDIDAAMTAAEETVANEEMKPAPGDTAAAEAAPAEVKLDTAGRPFDEAAAMMEAAIAEERAAAEAAAAATAASPPPEPPPPPAGSRPIEMPDLASVDADEHSAQSIDLLNDVELDVKIELGRSQMLIEDVLRLGSGSVVELDKLAGDPVDVFVNERLVARGEVIVLNENFCVRINEIVAGVEEEELV